MYLEKQFLIMISKCVSVLFGNKPMLEDAYEDEPKYESSWFVLHWLRCTANMMLSIQTCLTPRRLAIVEHKLESARELSPAPKMGQMERSDAFSEITSTSTDQHFVAAALMQPTCSSATLIDQECLSCTTLTDDLQQNNPSILQESSTPRPSPWETGSSASVSTLTTNDTDPPNSAAELVAKSALAEDSAEVMEDDDDEYIWDEMTARVDELLKQELKDSICLERTVADAEEHCSTVGQIHDMAARIKKLMDENDRLTKNLLMENVKQQSGEQIESTEMECDCD